MKKIPINVIPLIFLWLQLPLIAQDVAPDDATTAMTIEAGEPINNSDPANNEDVSSSPNYMLAKSPYAPELPDSGNTYEGPVGVTGIFNGNVATGCSYDPLSHSVHREVTDIVVPNSLGKYPLKMTRYYNSRQQYYALGAIGLSPGWAHEYSWLLWSAGHKVVSPHGNVYDDFCGAPVGISDGWEQRTDTYNGTWRLADGGKVIFVNGLATYIDDPYGVRTTITYSNGRILRVTETGGRYLQFNYGPASDPDGTLLLTRVEAHALGNATVTDSVTYSYTLISAGVQGRNKKMLTGVAYSDGTSASCEYRTDNVPENQTSHKMYPLLQRCDDARYNGPMRTIRYEYENGGPHGAIINEKYPDVGVVSAISPRAGAGDTFTETRGDGPTRSFTYTHMFHCHASECGPCDDVENNNPPQQMLTSYTDFQGHTTQLGYDSNWYINSVTDANNHATAYLRGPSPPSGIGQITRITHPGGAHIDYTYYNEGTGHIGGHYINTVTDERGNVTIYNRDGNYRVTSIDYKNNQNQVLAHEEFVYNNLGQVTRHKLKNGKYVHSQYDGRGLLTAKWNPTTNATAQSGDPKTTYTYWTNSAWADRVYQVTLPANVSNQVASERYEYDRNGAGNACAGRGLTTKITHANGKYQSFGYSQFGNKMWEENELRKRTSYTYDNYNRVLSVKNPLNKTETFDYSKPATASAYLHTTDSVYTHTSRTGIVTRNVYDPNWRKTSTTEASGTLNLTTAFAYDYVGNLTDVTDPRNKVTHNVYDNRNRKVSATEANGTPLAATTVWHYDGASNINQIDRPDGIQETKGFDGLNRMIWHTVPRQVPGQNPINLTTRFYYNPSGTLQKVTDANGHDTTFGYDASDRKITMTYHGTNGSQQWAYDNAGNLQNRITVNGERQDFAYDNLNRKIGMSWSNGADSAGYGYDDAGRLTSASNPNSTVTRGYDAAGHLTQDQQNVIGLGIKNVTYPLYDDDGRLKQISLSGVYDYTFGYDAAGRFETISAGGSTKFQYAYDAASNETHRYTYLSGVTIDQVYARDSLNRMSSRVLKKGTQTLSSEAYSYDHMNRITEVTRGNLADSFGFYWSGDLMSAQYGGTPHMPYTEGQDPDLDTTDTVDPNANYQTPDTEEPEPPPPPDDYSALPGGGPPPALPGGRSVMYYLDRAGNRTQLSDSVNGNPTYSRNAINQYTAVTGCTISNGAEHEISVFKGPSDLQQVNYYYVNDEHLKQVTSGSNTYDLKYDALGRCVKRTLNGVTTYYIYDGEKPILDYKSSDLTHPAKNVYGKGIDEILMRTDPTVNSASAFYYGQDHEGSVTHLINASGNVIESYRYDVFGAPTFYDGSATQIASTAYNNRFLFTGREYAATYQTTYTAAFTFYEYRARAYNPTLGRFMSEDPKLFDAGDYNLFRYCQNDPVDMTDPMGLDTAGPAPTSSMERLWAMTKWFDRSNIIQGNFAGFGTLSGQSDRAANGGLTMGQMTKGHPTGHRNFLGRLFHPRARVTGGTYEQRKLYREAIKKVFGTERGGDYVREIDARGYGVTVHLTHEDDAYSMGAPSSRVNIDPNYSGEVKTTAGCIPPTPTRLISHEFGHAVMRTLDDGLNRMNNVLRNENPIMRELGEPERLQYGLCP
jgi:RHS repeat-associated protein